MKSLMLFLTKFCSGCGACITTCHNRALSPDIDNGFVTVKINTDACTECNLCIKVCPVLSYMYSKRCEPTYNDIVGKHLKAFIAYAVNEQIRWNGASGGVITALLLYLLKENSIEGALVTKMAGKNCESYIAKTPEEVLASQGSTYFPAFGLQHLRELMHTSGHYAVVGLPCQIDALNNLKKLRPDFENKIFFTFGLFCFHVNEPWYLDYVIKRICKIEPKRVMAITARKSGWPGSIHVKSLDNSMNVSYSRFWYPLPVFHFTSPLGCLYCANRLNTCSDISFGDAWLPEIVKRDKLGSSIVIARTRKGLSLLKEAEECNKLHLEEISIDDVLKAQPVLSDKRQISIRRANRRGTLFESNNFNYPEMFNALLPMFHASITRKKFARGVIYNLPFDLLRTYCRLCGFIQKLV